MKTYLAKYALRNGVRGVLHVSTTCSCAAITYAMDLFGDSLCRCSARPS